MTDEPTYLYLTTLGRRTGKPHEIEIWFTERNGCYYVISERGVGAQWVRNLMANPAVRVRVSDVTRNAVARVVDREKEPDLHRAVRALSETKYGWGDGLVVELAPAE